MASDRDDTLKKAEKLLRQGRLDQAIAEYVRVVEANPRDWTTANTLGDLYVRAGQAERAAAQYFRIAKHFVDDGFYPKAAAIFRKILKIQPNDETTQVELAEVSAKHGLLADAKTHFSAVLERRRARGETLGIQEIIIRLGEIDPSDFEARRTAAKVMEEMGNNSGAADRRREIAKDLDEKGREDEALAELREAVRLDPGDTANRGRLAHAAVAAGRPDEARQYLTREVAGDDPALLEALLDLELRGGDADAGLALAAELLEKNPEFRERLLQIGYGVAEVNPDLAFRLLDRLIDEMTAAENWADAATVLKELVTRAPGQIPALLKLVEICVDGGLESTMYQAQAELTDAYLTSGQVTEACVIAEDLIAREPWESAHIERFRRALALKGTPNPDAVIAERLSGQSPFMATDPFAEPSDGPSPFVPAEPEPKPEPEPEPEAAPEPAPPEPAPPAPPGPPAPPRPKAPRDPAFRVTLGGLDLQSILGDLSAGRQAKGPAPAPESPPAPEQPAPEPPTPAAPPLDAVFKTMRREAAEREGGSDSGAQQVALAETYIEMGMIDEAITALEAAVRSPWHRFQAAARLGGLYEKRGELSHAVEWMERAAQAPPPTAEAGHALLYGLGETLEKMGETARALAVFLELQADVGDYKDVAARIERLARVQAGG